MRHHADLPNASFPGFPQILVPMLNFPSYSSPPTMMSTSAPTPYRLIVPIASLSSFLSTGELTSTSSA